MKMERLENETKPRKSAKTLPHFLHTNQEFKIKVSNYYYYYYLAPPADPAQAKPNSLPSTQGSI